MRVMYKILENFKLYLTLMEIEQFLLDKHIIIDMYSMYILKISV